jgi:hypothetical protein
MALETQYLQVVFAGGVDTKTDAKYVQENKLTNLENGVLTKTGTVAKRFGYENLTSGGISFTDSGNNVTLTETEALAVYKDQLLVLGNGYGASYSPSANLFNGVGKTPQVLVGSKQVAEDTNNQYDADWDCNANIAVYAWVDSNAGTTAIKYSVVDMVDNTMIVNKATVSTTSGVHSPKVVILDQYAYIFYAVSGSTNIRYRRIALSDWRTLAVEANFPSSNINSTLANQHYDIHKMDETRCAFAYNRAGGGVTFGIFTGNIAVPTVAQDAASVTENADNCISVITDASLNLWVGYHNQTNNIIRWFVRSVVLSAVLAPTSLTGSESRLIKAITMQITPQDPTICYFIYEDAGLVQRTFSTADVNTGTESITVTDHNLQSGMIIRFTDGGGGLPAPLVAGTDYYANVVDANTIRPCTTLYGAIAGEDIVNITTTGGANNIITPNDSYNGATAPYYWSWTTYIAVGTIGGTPSSRFTLLNQHLVSKAFTHNGEVFFATEYLSTEQPTYYVFSAFTGEMQAKMRPSEAQDVKQFSSIPKFVNYDGDSWGCPLGVRGRLINLSGTTRLWQQGMNLSTLTFGSRNQYFSEEFINNMVLQSGVLQSYDGSRLVEYGFNKWPEYFKAGIRTSSSTGLANGTYSYAVVYEWTDSAGIRTQSAPQFSSSVVVTGGPKAVYLVVETLPLRMTIKTNVIAQIYRTEANASIYYRLTSITAPTFITNTNLQLTYLDTAVDSAINTNEVLYTTGGELENIAPPSPKLIAVNKTRCFLVPSEYPQEIWYSKESTDNTEQPGFNPGFVKAFDLSGKEISALSVMDDKVVAFKDSKIFAFSGDGPNNLGQQDTFTEPELITSDVGCTEPSSITNTSEGIYFKSAKGFYLLSRDLNTDYVGRDVEAFNSEEVTSAALVSDTNQVRFTLGSGDCLVYDYFQKQWKIFANHSANDAVIYKNQYTYTRSGSTALYKEDPTSFKDDNVNVGLTIETGWIKLNSLQGFQRVRKGIVVGEFKSDHKLKISIAYDYQEYYTDQIMWSADDLFDVTLYGSEALFGSDEFFGTNDDETTYQVRFHMPRQKCESVKFKLEDVVVGDSGASMNISHLMLEVGLKQGVYKLNADKTVG